MTQAIKCFKKQKAFYFNAKGELISAGYGGNDIPVTGVVALSLDGGEPAIRFTFYRDWIREGGTYQEYAAMPAGD